MRKIRTLSGVASMIAVLIAVNLMILNESMFAQNVVNAFIFAAASGLVWLILYLVNIFGRGTQDGTPYGLNTAIASLAILVMCITTYAFVKRMDISVDLTQEGRRELAPQTRLVLESMTKPVEVYCIFVKTGDNRSIIAQDKTIRFLQQCQKYTNNITITILDPQKDLVQMQVLNAVRISNVGLIILKSETGQKEIPLSHVNARLEERDFTNALINVSRNEIPKVYFLDGHGGRDIDDKDQTTGGHLLKNLLLHEAYEVEKLLLSQDAPSIPGDASILIINNYTNDFARYEIAALDQFIQDGGRLLVFINPSVKLDQGIASEEQLRPWLLAKFGIDYLEDIIITPVGDSYDVRATLASDFSLLTDEEDPWPNAVEFRGSFHASHPITRNIDVRIDMQQLRTVQLTDPLPERVTGTTLLRTIPGSWGETDIQALMDEHGIAQDPFEAQGPNPVAVAVTVHTERTTMGDTRAEDARIVAIGDADSTSNQLLGYTGTADLILNSVAWLAESEDLIAIRPRGSEGQVLSVTVAEQRGVVWISVLGTLQVIVLIGILTFLYRRRYQ